MFTLTPEARNRGYYLVLEGDEGAGKSTQIELLVPWLEETIGVPVRFVREPGGDELAEVLREIVKHAEFPITPEAEVGLFSAARANMLKNVVEPLLAQGVWVIADRSKISTFVYQGRARGLIDTENFTQAVLFFANVVEPDLEFILDVSLDTSELRRHARDERTDRFESEDMAFRERVNAGYRQMCRYTSNVSGEGTPDDVHKRITEFVTEWANWMHITTTPNDFWRNRPEIPWQPPHCSHLPREESGS